MFRRAVRWTAADGTPLHLRVARASDAPQVKVALHKLSPETRRNRFFSPMPGFSDDLVRRLTDVDRHREHLVLVLRREAGLDCPVAGGRFVILEDEFSRHGEFALVVGDTWQGQGIGGRILGALVDEARRRDLAYLYGHVLADNARMLAFSARQGFRIEPGENGSLRRVTIEVPQRRHFLPRWPGF